MESEPKINEKISYDDDEINLVEYIQLIVRYKRFIFYFVVLSTLLSIVISLTKENQYKAKALISASSSDSGASARYLSLLKGVAGGMMDFGGGTNSEKIIGIIKSRSMADYLIEKFGLMEKFQSKIIDRVEVQVQSLIVAKVTKEGLIEVSVEYKDPALARDLVNACIDKLDKMNISYSIYGASNERIFLEQRLLEVKKNLAESENKLKSFQEENKLVELGTQTSSTVATISELYAKQIEIETQLGVKRRFKSEDDPEVLALKLTVDEIKKQIDALSKSDNKGNTSSDITSGKNTRSKDYLISLEQTPTLALTYLRLKRELKIQETLFELLTEQYELAKINEQKNVPTLTIIDRAKEPLVKSKPKRRLIVMVSFILSTFVGTFMVFIIEFIKNFKKNFSESRT